MNTEKRIISGVFVGFISFGLTFIQSILIVPILLSIWGKETYGIWIVLNAGFIILQTLDSGQQSYIGNEFNIKFFSDKKDLRVVLASSLRIAFLIGIAQLLIVFFLFLTNTTHLYLGLDSLTVSKEYLNLCLLLLIIAWISSGTYASILSKLMIPYGYYSKSSWWGIYKRTGAFLVLIIIALSKGSILDATIGITLSNLVFNFLLLFRIKSLMPDVYPWWHQGNWKTGWVNLRRSSLISISGVLKQFSNNGLILLITNLFGAAVVPLYSTMNTLTNSVTSITNILIQPLQPDLVKFRHQNKYKKLLETFDVNWLISGFIVNVCILVILPFISDIYTIWTRGKIEFDLTFFLLLIWSVSILNFGTPFMVYIDSLNRIKQNFVIVILKLLLVFGISLFLSNYIGIISIGIAIAIAQFLTFFLLPYLFFHAEFRSSGFKINHKDILVKMIPSLLLGIIFFLIILFKINLFILSFSGLGLMIFIYYIHWKLFSPELREKVISIINIRKFLDIG